jgi:hypothetical protein
MDIRELSKITDDIFSNPSHNVDSIKLMRERYLRKSNEKDNDIKEKNR